MDAQYVQLVQPRQSRCSSCCAATGWLAVIAAAAVAIHLVATDSVPELDDVEVHSRRLGQKFKYFTQTARDAFAREPRGQRPRRHQYPPPLPPSPPPPPAARSALAAPRSRPNSTWRDRHVNSCSTPACCRRHPKACRASTRRAAPGDLRRTGARPAVAAVLPPSWAAGNWSTACAPPSAADAARLAAARAEAARATRRAVGRWQEGVCDGVGEACRPLTEVVPPAGSVAAVADALPARPRVYVYECLDGPLEALVRRPALRKFFDANLAHNQYISEYALHRALLASPLRELDPNRAHWFFVPFYSRLAYANKASPPSEFAAQRALTDALARCLTASPWYRRSRGADHLSTISSTRDPAQLYGAAWPLVQKGLVLRIDNDVRYGARGMVRSADGQGLVLPYYVPSFVEDEAAAAGGGAGGAAARPHSVCFFGSDTNPLRRAALRALSSVSRTRLQLVPKEGARRQQRFGGPHIGLNASARAVVEARALTARSRRAMRGCQLCLVPAGITPSSRRFYEAVVAGCIPLLLADRFEPALAALLPVESYTVRARQKRPEELPAVVAKALRRYDELAAALRAARPALVLPLGLRAPPGGEVVAHDAVVALVAEAYRRYPRRAAKGCA